MISESSKGNDIVYAFGHGHIGLTLAPITAEIVDSIITKTKPPVPISESVSYTHLTLPTKA